MTAPANASHDATEDTPRLRRGRTYRAITKIGEKTGEYLGMESPHGDLSILLRDAKSTHSIDLNDITAIHAA